MKSNCIYGILATFGNQTPIKFASYQTAKKLQLPSFSMENGFDTNIDKHTFGTFCIKVLSPVVVDRNVKDMDYDFQRCFVVPLAALVIGFFHVYWTYWIVQFTYRKFFAIPEDVRS